METYVIVRRSGWRPRGPAGGCGPLHAEGRSMSDDIRWIRSYVLGESDGSVGTVCVYQASSPEAIGAHASAPICRWTRSSRSPTP